MTGVERLLSSRRRTFTLLRIVLAGQSAAASYKRRATKLAQQLAASRQHPSHKYLGVQILENTSTPPLHRGNIGEIKTLFSKLRV